MRRRDLLTLAVAAATLRPRVAGTQPNKVATIGLLGIPQSSDPQFAPIWQAFVEAMRKKGWREGDNITFIRRWSEGRSDSYEVLAAEIIAARPSLIVALSSQAMRAARQRTDTIPIIAVGNTDLVAFGLIASLARPGGNLTGFSVEFAPIEGKLLQMLQEARPGLSRIVVLYTPGNPVSKSIAEKEASLAAPMGIAVELVPVDTPDDLDAAFAAIEKIAPDALNVGATPVLFGNTPKIATFAVEHRLPTICGFDGMTRAGLLLSYSPDYVEMWSRAGIVADKILRGSKPADIPAEQPTRFNLVINLKTAREIGLTIPHALLLRADEVIE